MIGQTLPGRYRYYRCRRAFAGPKHDGCDSRYVRADKLEARLLEKIADALSHPTVILGELIRLRESAETAADEDGVRQRLESVERQRTRLVRLYQLGEIDDEYLERETSSLRAERRRLENLLPSNPPERDTLPNDADLAALCTRVRTWILSNGQKEVPLISRALQLSILASTDRSEVAGILPEYSPAGEHPDVRTVVTRP